MREIQKPSLSELKKSDHKERKTTPTIVKEKGKYKTDRHKHCQQKKKTKHINNKNIIVFTKKTTATNIDFPTNPPPSSGQPSQLVVVSHRCLRCVSVFFVRNELNESQNCECVRVCVFF